MTQLKKTIQHKLNIIHKKQLSDKWGHSNNT
jgi:hypothetical protein